MPQELLLGKHQLSELGSESAKIKAMGIMDRVSYCFHKNEDIVNVYRALCDKFRFGIHFNIEATWENEKTHICFYPYFTKNIYLFSSNSPE